MKHLYALLLLSTVALTAAAQTLDKKFYITDKEVVNVVQHGNTIYLGGNFTAVGPNTGHAALFDDNTGLWNSGIPAINGEVDAIAADGNGGWYIGGYFNYADDDAVTNLVHIKADKTLDKAFAPQPDLTVSTLCVYNNVLYVGGKFNNVGSTARHHAAAFDMATGNLTAWDPSPDNWVYNIVAGNGFVYLLGNFGNAGGQPRNELVAVDPLLGIANTFTITQNSSSGISCIALMGDTLYLGGNFTQVNGAPRVELAAVNVITGIPTSWSPTADNLVSNIYATPGKIFISGAFDLVNNNAHLGLAALDPVSGNVDSWNAQVAGYNAVSGNIYAMVRVGDTLYAAGHFKAIGGETRSNLGAINVTTGLATDWNPQANANAYALAYGNNMFCAGGDFTSANTVARTYIAAMDANTGMVTPWAPNLDGNVHGMAVKGDSVIISGEFFNVNGSSRRFLAGVDSASGNLLPWNPNPNGRIYAIDVLDSMIYVAGHFDNIGGDDKYAVAAINGDNGAVRDWDIQINQSLNTVLNGIKATPKSVYIWGSFNTLGADTRHNIAELDAVTGKATNFNPDADGAVRALTINNNKVYVGGNFAHIGGQARNGIAQLDKTGTASSWNPNVTGSFVNTIAVTGGIVYAGGTFSSVSGQSRSNIAAITVETGELTDWNAGTNYAPVDVIVPFKSQLIFAGNFTQYRHYSVSNIAVAGKAITLPMQLLSFNAATKINNAVALDWSTANELNAAYFDVERSNDGNYFTRLNKVTAGNKSFNTYTYTDAALKTGNVIYYRLKMVDADGGFTYSKTLVVHVALTSNNFLVYPNPVHSQLGINVTSETNQKAMLVITDMNGKVVQQQAIDLHSGNNNVAVSLSTAVNGTYIAELRMGDKKVSKTFIRN